MHPQQGDSLEKKRGGGGWWFEISVEEKLHFRVRGCKIVKDFLQLGTLPAQASALNQHYLALLTTLTKANSLEET